ncbi:MAG: glycosyltransferase [Actinomycetales bacterium]
MKQTLLGALIYLRDSLPEVIGARLRPRKHRYKWTEVPRVPSFVSARRVLYIAPANFAGQAFRWARAAELNEGVSASNLESAAVPSMYESDYRVGRVVARSSRRWQRKHFASVSRSVSHLLIEASRPTFGPLFGEDVSEEVAALERAGITVGMLCHGSDIRLPSRHAANHPFSPFNVMSAADVTAMESVARENQNLLSNLGAPIFVSTPALLVEVPNATWLPVVIDIERWSNERVPLERTVPVVVHAPSREVIKRTDLVDSALLQLHDAGEIVYKRITGIPNEKLPALFAEADVLVDALGTGNYGVAACEGMAAGCLVVSYITSQVSGYVESSLGVELPIVNSEPDALVHTMRRVLSERKRHQEIAAKGYEFVAKHHDGRLSASVLRDFLDS